MECNKMYENVINELAEMEGSNEEKFNELFLLTCMLIWNMSCGNEKQLGRILTLLNEFDYKRNFESEE